MASIRNLAERAPGAFSSACKFLSIGSSPTAARRIASPVLTISPPGPVNCWPATVKHSRSARISSAVRRTCPSPYRAALASSGAAGTAAAYTQPEWLCATASMTELYAWRLSGSPALRLAGDGQQFLERSRDARRYHSVACGMDQRPSPPIGRRPSEPSGQPRQRVCQDRNTHEHGDRSARSCRESSVRFSHS
jgi:hypothetical protein